MCRKIRVQVGETGTRLWMRSRELIPDTITRDDVMARKCHQCLACRLHITSGTGGLLV